MKALIAAILIALAVTLIDGVRKIRKHEDDNYPHGTGGPA